MAVNLAKPSQVPPAGQAQKVAFRYGTRQRYRKVAAGTSVSPGNSVSPSIEVRQVGFLNSLDLILRSAAGVGITTGGVAPTLAGARRWPASLIKRLTVSLSSGAILANIPGEQLEFLNWLIEHNYNPGKSTDADLNSAAFNNINTTNRINQRYRLPIAANDAADFTVGLLMLQSQQLQLNVDILWDTLADVFSANAPTLTATAPSLDVSSTIYAAPDPTRVLLPYPSLHRFMENRFTSLVTGWNTIKLPREGILLRLYLQVVLNGAYDTNNYVDNIQVWLNDSAQPYDFTRQQLKALAVQRYGQDLPQGWYVLDLWHANHHVAGGDQRDTIDTDKFSTTEIYINIDSAATIAAGDYISIMREFIQFPRKTS